MGLIRMFHYSCDVDNYTFGCEGETGDEWYAASAKKRARDDGWHINAEHAICPACWDSGARYKDCR